VTKIIQDASGVEVIVGSGETIHTKHVIFTGTPWTSSKVAWSPPLPSAKQQLLDKLRMGNGVKMSVFYDTPFWRQRNSTGSIISTIDIDGMFFPGCLDNSPLNSSIGVLMCIVGGNTSTKLMNLPKSARQDAMVSFLARALGKQALTPFHYEDKDWSASPYIGGAVCPIFAPGVLTHEYAALASDFGHVTWAGSDTRPVGLANSNFGFIDGAIQSGELAARRILKSLDGDGVIVT
jgi:monoamine oxidase